MVRTASTRPREWRTHSRVRKCARVVPDAVATFSPHQKSAPSLARWSLGHLMHGGTKWVSLTRSSWSMQELGPAHWPAQSSLHSRCAVQLCAMWPLKFLPCSAPSIRPESSHASIYQTAHSPASSSPTSCSTTCHFDCSCPTLAGRRRTSPTPAGGWSRFCAPVMSCRQCCLPLRLTARVLRYVSGLRHGYVMY